MSENLIELVRQHEVLYDTKCEGYKDQVKRAAAWESIAIQLNANVNDVKEAWRKLRNAYSSAIKRRKTKKSGQAAEKVIPWKYEERMEFLRAFMETRTTISNLIFAPPCSTSLLQPPPPSHMESSMPPIVPTQRISSPTSFSQLSLSPEQSEELFSSRPLSPPSVSSTLLTESSENSRPVSIRSTKRSQAKNDEKFDSLYNLIKSSQEMRAKKMLLRREEMDETDLFFLSMSRTVKKLDPYDQTRIKLELHKSVNEAELNMMIEPERYQPTGSPRSPPLLEFSHQLDLEQTDEL